MELFSPSFRKMWKEWDLRVAVLISLTLQILLIILGNRRKYNHKLWIRIVVWSAYLAADSVATFALGVLSNNLSDMIDARSLDANSALTAFWAPFLLLHLGGPDTITAYALEDNELWLRHFLGLAVQTGIALYVFLLSWTGSLLSILCNLMFFTGLIKYGERTWILRSASNEKFRESFAYGTGYRNLDVNREVDMDEYLKRQEGYFVRRHMVSEVQLPVDSSIFNNNSISDQDKLLAGHGLLNITKRLFVDAILNSSDRDTSETVFRHMSSENVFQVIEIQLGLIYDLLHTKSMLLYTRWGLTLRLIAFFLTCLVLLLFIFLDHKHKYSKIDLVITFLLLAIGIILELYAALVMISSDQFVVWLNMHKKTSILQVLTSLPLLKSPRWSNKMCQYSLLSFSMKEKSLPFHNILKLLTIDRKLEKRWYISDKEVPDVLKKLIVRYVKVRNASKTLSDHEILLFAFLPTASGRVEFNGYYDPDKGTARNILAWHIVTEVAYCLDIEDIKQRSKIDAEHCKLIKWISRYMMYLLVMHPSMLSAEPTSEISLGETIDQTVDVLRRSEVLNGKAEACKKLIEWLDDPTSRADQESEMSTLRNALHSVKQLTDPEQDKIEKWNKIGWKWLQMLTDAASGGKGNLHGQQLRRGGELLTHVWLLMAHFGMTTHFLISDPQTLFRTTVT